MKPSSLTWTRLVLFAFAAVLLGTSQAHAKRGFKLITTGTSLSELGPVKAEHMEDVKLPVGTTLDKVGYKYDYFGLFWLDLWNWGGEYCVFSGDNYAPVDKKEAARLMGTDESKLGKPLNYRFPYGLDILLALGLLKFVPRILASRKRKSQAVPSFDGPVPAWTPPATGNSGPPPMPPPMPPDQQ